MTGHEIKEMVVVEEKCLGVGSKEFMERHIEIMEGSDRLLAEMKKLRMTGYLGEYGHS